MRNGARQVAVNITGGVCTTIRASLRKQGAVNVLDRKTPQHYTSILVVYETDSDKRMFRQHRIHGDNEDERGRNYQSDLRGGTLPHDGRNNDSR